MENHKEIQDKIEKYKKEIAKKEKKLAKVNRVLKAKEHVKQKLKECNPPGQENSCELSVTVCPNSDELTAQIKHTRFSTGNNIATLPGGQDNTQKQSLNSNKVNKEFQIEKSDKNNTLYNCIISNSETKTKIYPQYYLENILPNDVSGKCSGDSEKAPIVIADSQTVSSNTVSLSSDNSLNSKISGRKLSIKRKKTRSHTNLQKKVKCSQLFDDEKVTTTLVENQEREITPVQSNNVKLTLPVQGIENEKTYDQSSVGHLVEINDLETDSDSLSLLQQNPPNFSTEHDRKQITFADNQSKNVHIALQIPVNNLSGKIENFQREDISEKQNSKCHSSDIVDPMKFGSSAVDMCTNSLTSHFIEMSSQESLFDGSQSNTPSIAKGEFIHPKQKSRRDGQLVSFSSQETTMGDMLETGLSVDLDQAFLHQRPDETRIDLNDSQMSLSSSQESIIKSTQEISQPRRRGRPSKSKTMKTRSSLTKVVLQTSPLHNEYLKGKLETNDQEKEEKFLIERKLQENSEKNKNIHINRDGTSDIIQLTQEDVIGPTQRLPSLASEKQSPEDYQLENKCSGTLPCMEDNICEHQSTKKFIMKKKDSMHINEKQSKSSSQENEDLKMSSQDSDVFSGAAPNTEKRRRGRPRKKQSNIGFNYCQEKSVGGNSVPVSFPMGILETSKQESSQTVLTEICNNNASEENTKDKFSQETSGSQELFEPGYEYHKNTLQNKKISDSQITDYKSSHSNTENCIKISSEEHSTLVSPELSTMQLIQESFIEKKEYSTRRRSSMGSPFIISSIFQYIIDESKRIKGCKEFCLPNGKFGRLMAKRQNEFDARDGFEDSQDFVNDGHTQSMMNCVTMETEVATESSVSVNIEDEKTTKNSLKQKERGICYELEVKENSDIELQYLETKINDQDVDTDSQGNIKLSDNYTSNTNKELTESHWNENGLKESNIPQPQLTSSQLNASITKDDKEHTLCKENQEVNYTDSQTDTMESQADEAVGTDVSLTLPDTERLIALCSCKLKCGKKEIPIIGCLTAKSLLLWKQNRGFSFLHRWDFHEKYKAEKVSSFSLQGRAFFITVVRGPDDKTEIYMSYYYNKKDNCIFSVTTVESSVVECCHINNRVVVVGYNQGETISVIKFVLHNKLKSMATRDQLEKTDGCIQSIHCVDNLPSAVCVWSQNGEVCLWNTESKRLLLKIKPDLFGSKPVPRLVGSAWEQGYIFLQLFHRNTVDSCAGDLVTINPTTKKSCISAQYKSTEFHGYKNHCTTGEMVILLDSKNNVMAWDRFSTEMLLQSYLGHALYLTVVNRHILSGGDNCVHIH